MLHFCQRPCCKGKNRAGEDRADKKCRTVVPNVVPNRSLDSNKTVGFTSYTTTRNRVWRYNLLPILLDVHRSLCSTFCIRMAKPTSKPTRHQRTRKDHSTETAEDYVEAVAELIATKSQCRLVELAKYFGVSHVTANRIVARLAKEGLLHTEPYRPIELTATGRRLAKSCQERHEIVRSFLIALGLDSTTADIDSEGIEHHVSPKTLELFQRFVDRLGDNPDY